MALNCCVGIVGGRKKGTSIDLAVEERDLEIPPLNCCDDSTLAP